MSKKIIREVVSNMNQRYSTERAARWSSVTFLRCPFKFMKLTKFLQQKCNLPFKSICSKPVRKNLNNGSDVGLHTVMNDSHS